MMNGEKIEGGSELVLVSRAAIENAIATLERDGDEHGVALNLFATLATAAAQHPDDAAVDAFAAALKAKLADARAKGRGGWEDKAECTQLFLSHLLRGHVEKGDPRDVANFCCFLWNRGEGILAAPPLNEPFGNPEQLPLNEPSGDSGQLASLEQRAQELGRFGRAPAGSPYLLVPMDDGYWTPWHLAQKALDAAALSVQPRGPGALLTEAECGVIETLLQLAYAAWRLGDDSEHREGGEVCVPQESFDELAKHLDALEELPDDQPGYTMGEAAKARWALRRLLNVPPAAPQPREVRGVDGWSRADIADLRDRLISSGISKCMEGTSKKASDYQFIRAAFAEASSLLESLLATTPQDAAGVEAYPTGSDREVLLYLMQQFDVETWECPRCGHSEDTSTMDSADYLRKYLAEHQVTPPPGVDAGKLRELRSLLAGIRPEFGQPGSRDVDVRAQQNRIDAAIAIIDAAAPGVGNG